MVITEYRSNLNPGIGSLEASDLAGSGEDYHISSWRKGWTRMLLAPTLMSAKGRKANARCEQMFSQYFTQQRTYQDTSECLFGADGGSHGFLFQRGPYFVASLLNLAKFPVTHTVGLEDEEVLMTKHQTMHRWVRGCRSAHGRRNRQGHEVTLCLWTDEHDLPERPPS